ncbi:MAG: hypothetical protein R3F37_19440 [Candidatus Competibacteraceae bacterium]
MGMVHQESSRRMHLHRLLVPSPLGGEGFEGIDSQDTTPRLTTQIITVMSGRGARQRSSAFGCFCSKAREGELGALPRYATRV